MLLTEVRSFPFVRSILLYYSGKLFPDLNNGNDFSNVADRSDAEYLTKNMPHLYYWQSFADKL